MLAKEELTRRYSGQQLKFTAGPGLLGRPTRKAFTRTKIVVIEQGMNHPESPMNLRGLRASVVNPNYPNFHQICTLFMNT